MVSSVKELQKSEGEALIVRWKVSAALCVQRIFNKGGSSLKGGAKHEASTQILWIVKNL